MLNFVIYEDDVQVRNIYKNIIHNIFAPNNNAYRIYEFEKYDEKVEKFLKNIKENKIFLLDIEVPGKTGVEFAREIRKSGDWLSQLIVITSHDEIDSTNIMNRILMLDFILKDENLENSLIRDIKTACEIFYSNKTISIKQNSEIYKIRYDEILYVEKDLNENYVTIYTKDSKFSMKCSINNFQTLIEENPNFMKIHRSCIINLNNVKSYDSINNIIKFENNSVDLISRNKKKELKDKLLQFQ